MSVNSSIVETAHGDISVACSESEGSVILFLHGNSSSKSAFLNQLSGSLGKRFRCVAIDFPGHGDSTDAKDPVATYTQPGYAETALEVLRSIRVNRAVVVGWSLGGHVGHVGIEMLASSSLVAGLLICGTPPCGPGAESVANAFFAVPELSFASKEVFTLDDSQTFARYILGQALPGDHELVQAVIRTDGQARRIMWKHWAVENKGCNQIRIVEESNVPIAVIHGDADPFLKTEYLKKIEYGNLWRDKVQILPGIGHAPFYEVPEKFNELLEQIVDSIA